MMYNPRTEQYLAVGDPVTVADPVTLRGAGTIRDFTKNDQGQVFVAVDLDAKLYSFPIEQVVLRGVGKLLVDMADTSTTRLIYTLVDLHESRYFLNFRAATKDERTAYVEAIEEEINRRIPPRRRI